MAAGWLEDVSKGTAQTWDISISTIMNPSMWSLAWKLSSDTHSVVKTFQNMQDGSFSGAFRYGLFVVEKPLGNSTTALISYIKKCICNPHSGYQWRGTRIKRNTSARCPPFHRGCADGEAPSGALKFSEGP
jgi:hypothetical protein